MNKLSLFLVGPMGAGKTTIGKRLARRLGYEFRDCDRILEQRTGVDIPLIFELEGEEGFRDRESALLDELTQESGIVLATGGGAVLRPENRAHLLCRGFVVHLGTSVEEQLRRTEHDSNRPLLQTPDRRACLEKLKRTRDPLYREVADLSISTDGRRAHKVVQDIARRFLAEQRPGARAAS
jgi:shikimate kinase